MDYKTDKTTINRIIDIFIGFSFIIIGFIEYSSVYFNITYSLWIWLWIFEGIFMLIPYIFTKNLNTLIRALFLIITGTGFLIAQFFKIIFNPALPVLLTIIIISLYIYFFESQMKQFLLTVNLMIFIFFILVIITFFKNRFWFVAFFIYGLYMIIRGITHFKDEIKS